MLESKTKQTSDTNKRQTQGKHQIQDKYQTTRQTSDDKTKIRYNTLIIVYNSVHNVLIRGGPTFFGSI